MQFHELTSRNKGKTARRVGRGGKRGKTSGRGGKGQTARAGNKPRPEWRDMIKKIPKRRGFGRNRSRTAVPHTAKAPVSIAALAEHFKSGEVVSPASLVAKGILHRASGRLPAVKVLGSDEKVSLPKLSLEGVAISASARAAVEAAGGSVKTK